MGEGQRGLTARIEEAEGLFHAGRLQEAYEAFLALTKEAPESALVWNDLGAVLYAGGRESEARDAFEKAARLAPADADILLNLAELHLEAGRTEAALPHLRNFHDAHPTRQEGQDLLRWIGVRRDDRTRVLFMDFARETGKSRRFLAQALREGGLQVRDVHAKTVDAAAALTGRSRDNVLEALVRGVRPYFVIADRTHFEEATKAAAATGAAVVDIARFIDADGNVRAEIGEILDGLGSIPGTMPAGDPVQPLLSVLVHAEAEWKSARALLDRLALQDLDPCFFEVVVAFRGAREAWTPLVRAERWPFATSFIDAVGESADAARDAALTRARGELAVLFEADARPAFDNLRRHLQAHADVQTPAIVQGGLEYAESESALARAIQHASLAPSLGAARVAAQLHGHFVLADNTSLPCADIAAQGGFAQGLDLAEYGHVALFERLMREHGYGLVRQGVIRSRLEREVSVTSFASEHSLLTKARIRAVQVNPAAAPILVQRSETVPLRWTRLDARRLRDEALAALRGGPTTDELVRALEVAEPMSSESLSALQNLVGRLRWIAQEAVGSAALAELGFADRRPLSAAPSLFERATSVIMLNLNGFPHVREAVSSLRAHTKGPYELIVVDNGSTDGSAEWLAEQRDVRLVRLGRNLGAPAARNAGLEYAGGGTVLFCDNDVVFTPRWRETLLAHLEAHPDVGMVGPMSDCVSGSQKSSLQPGPHESLDDFAQRFTEQNAGQHIYAARLILFFLLVRREVIERIGGIDTRYGRWGFEDDDYCLRALKAGFQLRVARDCFVRHLGSQTAKTAKIDYEALLVQNWQEFKARFGLPEDLEYGQSWDIDAVLAKPFDPREDRVPYGLASLERRADERIEAAASE